MPKRGPKDHNTVSSLPKADLYRIQDEGRAAQVEPYKIEWVVFQSMEGDIEPVKLPMHCSTASIGPDGKENQWAYYVSDAAALDPATDLILNFLPVLESRVRASHPWFDSSAVVVVREGLKGGLREMMDEDFKPW